MLKTVNDRKNGRHRNPVLVYEYPSTIMFYNSLDRKYPNLNGDYGQLDFEIDRENNRVIGTLDFWRKLYIELDNKTPNDLYMRGYHQLIAV